ncbi:HNH endonuclease domain-containing protein [Fontisphaera persica]|uniref:type II CRISPR RNA-guided endonuclease Cas9 n=1 Tax=Fontisphaera persica TaxID=2974023 RepID=UPI0024BF2AF7|nr:type II CRISPR RNA-guided endonuclease Cas9 [Fontisphaera persica]WCJ57866.1 HNH endonuclease domain-containing protein [Fontisphaera persica]
MQSNHKNTPSQPDLELAFDVGHSSIGWAVLQEVNSPSPANDELPTPALLGCGVVIFGADDCLAKKRRDYRRQRRHIRATRQRIARLKSLLAHLGVLKPHQLDKPGCAWPWLLAARVLRGGPLLSWPELWDVLRWYAHNRGYNANRLWSRQEHGEEEDAEKVQNARHLLEKHQTRTMAETICAICGLDPLGNKRSCHLPGDQRPKGLNAAFPREIVEAEVLDILERHKNRLPQLNQAFIHALMSDWKAIGCPSIKLPERYHGGLLFGQLVPRFDNRIISSCPITFEKVFQQTLQETQDPKEAEHRATKAAKVPAAKCPEFLRFRWAMLLANVKISQAGNGHVRPLSVTERQTLHQKMEAKGFLTKDEFKKAVRELTHNQPDNLDQMLMPPDADKMLVLDPVKKALSQPFLIAIWPHLPIRLQKRAIGQLRHGKSITLAELCKNASEEERRRLQQALQDFAAQENTKKKRGQTHTVEDWLKQRLHADLPSARAPYTREVMRQAWQDVMEKGIHPKEKDGCLYRDEAIREAQIQRSIDQQTNNHLVRHRLKILERLHQDILKAYANEDPSRIKRITIEVNRELRDYSGMTRKEQEQDLGQRLAHFKSAVKKLEEDLKGNNIRITAGLIRKARIAMDLDWTCPYTGKDYDAITLARKGVDKDHVIPRSQRASDSLDSLVITFPEVNRMKGKRTALAFIEEFQGRTVEGRPDLTIRTVSQYRQWVESLDTRKGHAEDIRRKKRRKELLLLRDYVEEEFTPRDLTQTSQLVRLGAALLQRPYLELEQKPVITSLPGSVTAFIRRGWQLLGCLSLANPQVLDESGHVRTKDEIRGITHLHHALDACTLALASHYLPRDGHFWRLLLKRRLNSAEQRQLAHATRGLCQFNNDGEVVLRDLPAAFKEQLRQRLAERRVVQHIPKDMSGLPAEETVYRVFDPQDSHPSAKRLRRWFEAQKVKIPAPQDDTVLIVCRKRISSADAQSGTVLHETKTWRWVYKEVEKSKLIGLNPEPGSPGKLKKLKAVKIIGDNFGIALDPQPTIIRFHKVWHQLQALRRQNQNRPVRVLRNGQLIRVPDGRYEGVWRIASVKAAMTLDIIAPDRVKVESKGVGIKRDVKLATLVKNAMEILDSSYVGIAACPITSST